MQFFNSSTKAFKKSKKVAEILMSISFSQKLIKCMIQKGVISSDDEDVFLYGVKQGFLMLLNIVTFVLIGLFSGTLIYVTTFLIAVMMLRSFAGGYHASTPMRCYLVSSMMVFVVALLSLHIQINQLVLLGLLVILGILIILLSPVDTTNKRLDELEKKVYKRKATKICIIEVIIALAFLSARINFIVIGIFWALVLILFMQILEMVVKPKVHE